MRRAWLLPFALLLAAMSEPDCPVTSRYCVVLGDAYGDTLVEIYRRDGALVRKLSAADVFTANDAQSLQLRYFKFEPRYLGESLIAAVPTRSNDANAPTEEIRIDLADGKVTRPEHDIFPAPRVWATEVDPNAPPSKAEPPPCLSPTVVRISSGELLARAIEQPPPKYPPIAVKVRVGGVTRVEVVVSESGDVVCTRVSKPLPFGIDKASNDAVREWKFAPSRDKVVGEVEFHFQRVPWDFRP